MFVDTHAHLWWPGPARSDKSDVFPGYDDDLDDVINRAQTAGVERMIVPGTDITTSLKAIELARKYPGVLFAAVGIHPEETEDTHIGDPLYAESINTQMRNLRKMIEENSDVVKAVGEIGTDANTAKLRDAMPRQKELFREQLEIAQDYDLPVIIHTRKSFADTMQVIDYLSQKPRGQFHCFSYDTQELTAILDRGFSVSFCGNITWSKRLQRLCPMVPADRLLLETDSPLMIPRTIKGDPIDTSLRNTPQNVTILAQFQAELRGVPPGTLGEQTTANAVGLYRL